MPHNREWGPAAFVVETKDRPAFTVTVAGRDRWTLEQLIATGDRGCTPIDNPAPRWSGYVFKLRGLGVPVETITEQHHGPFAGTHARYVLRARVIRQRQEAAE